MLQDRAQRRTPREAVGETFSEPPIKKTIGHLKEFYLQRLAKAEPAVAARLAVQVSAPFQPAPFTPVSSLGQRASRPTFTSSSPGDIEELEIMCNNCFTLIKSSEASSCTGDHSSCPIAQQGGSMSSSGRPTSQLALLDLKLQRLRSSLELRLADASSKLNVMRHFMQLRYHLDTAAKWAPGCSEIGALSTHTVVQVKQLTTTARTLAPAVYIFSKRIENIVIAKERELRRTLLQAAPARAAAVTEGGPAAVARTGVLGLSMERSSVAELDSDCGTQYTETLVTQEGPGGQGDVGNLQDAMDYLSLKNEDEQRRWFYSQCLTLKLACSDKTRARKTLISDLYGQVRAQDIPIESWVKWIKAQLIPEEPKADSDVAGVSRGLIQVNGRHPSAGYPSPGRGDSPQELDNTQLVARARNPVVMPGPLLRQ